MAATQILGRNIQFPIYKDVNGQKQNWNNLVLRKSALESVVMSLGDKISGDVYYKDNTLNFTSDLYIEYNDVKYTLVNPPIVIKEGLVNDNSDLKGMTKYSLVFYHPMYILGNLPFSDVAVTQDEQKYLSENKTFSWIGKPQDYLAKLNKNLDGTEWICELSSSVPQDKLNELSEVLTFDNNTIADALKTWYETWGLPFVVGQVKITESAYASGKRFKVVLGYPSNEIEYQGEPYVFRYGQGVGLKNNSRNPRNNKIITRIAGAGSEDNIPYGYPQIIWYGVQDWEYSAYTDVVRKYTRSKDAFDTDMNQRIEEEPMEQGKQALTEYKNAVDNQRDGSDAVTGLYQWTVTVKKNYVAGTFVGYHYESTDNVSQSGGYVTDLDASTPAPNAYPLYNGIVGGQWVKLIKHPFTRTTLMPSIYSQTVFNKVSPYLPDGTTNSDYDPDTELVDYYDAVYSQEYPYPNPINRLAPSYESHKFEDIKPEFDPNEEQGIVAVQALNNDLTPATEWDDSLDDEGNYVQSYFQITLPQLEFDLYACAAITQEMQINMRSGACLGCTFTIQVDWEDYKKNFYSADGKTFLPDGEQRDLTKYPKSNLEQINVVVQKDLNTFGTIMPNVYQYPEPNDLFVILGISLPLSYIQDAEQRLDAESKSFMLENNVYYFDYPLKFDEYFLANHTDILSQIQPNAIVHFAYANEPEPLQLYVKQITVRFGDSPLPQYDITLTDNIEVVLNQIGHVASDVEKLSSLISAVRQSYGRNVWYELNKKLAKDKSDRTPYDLGARKFVTENGIESSDFTKGVNGGALWKDESDNWHFESDYINARKKFVAKEVQIEDVHHVGGQMLLTAASCKCDFVVETTDGNGNPCYRCFFLKKDDSGKEITNDWRTNDQAFVNTFNLEDDEQGNDGNHYLWYLVSSTSNTTSETHEQYVIDGVTYETEDYHFIDLPKTFCDEDSSAPLAGDNIVQLGHRGNDTDRQNAIIIAGAGEGSPYIQQFVGIDDFRLPDPQTQIKPNENVFTGMVTMQAGSVIDGQVLDENVKIGRSNFLLNTGFRGQYESVDLVANTELDSDFELWSPSLDNWTAINAYVQDSQDSASTKECVIRDGSIVQELTLPVTQGTARIIPQGTACIFTFKGKGSGITFACGGNTIEVPLTSEYAVHSIPFTTNINATTFTIEGNATICELYLEKGTVASTSWEPSPFDNDPALGRMQELQFLTDAIHEASTTMLGGLVLSNIIEVGNYVDGEMKDVTAGMSGVYNDDDDVAFFGGGTLKQAIEAVSMFKSNPNYRPTQEEWDAVAHAVITHGGRAILNDVILKGNIYAENGYFKGELQAANGTFTGELQAANGTFTGELSGVTGTFTGTISSNDNTVLMTSSTLEDAWGLGFEWKGFAVSCNGLIDGDLATFGARIDETNNIDYGRLVLVNRNHTTKYQNGTIILDANDYSLSCVKITNEESNTQKINTQKINVGHHVYLNSAIIGSKLNEFTPSANANIIQIVNGNKVLLYGTYQTVYLPTLAMCKAALGITDDTHFSIELIVMCTAGSNSHEILGYTQNDSSTHDCPHIRGDNYADEQRVGVGEGDTAHFEMVYNGTIFDAFIISHRY